MAIQTTLTPWRPGMGMTVYDGADNYSGRYGLTPVPASFLFYAGVLPEQSRGLSL